MMKRILLVFIALLFTAAAQAASVTINNVDFTASCTPIIEYHCGSTQQAVTATIVTDTLTDVNLVLSTSPHDTDCYPDLSGTNCVDNGVQDEATLDPNDDDSGTEVMVLQNATQGHLWIDCKDEDASCTAVFSVTIDCPADSTPNIHQSHFC